PFNAVDTVGEILLSLSYLPTAERLTVVVVKAKNLLTLTLALFSPPADPFVKVYLLQDGRKISKKKTAVKRDDTNPVFNEAMIFSVPAIELSLRVTVAECGEDGRADNTGHVLIGPTASGMGTTHWNQMLATLRRPVSMWHPLRRKDFGAKTSPMRMEKDRNDSRSRPSLQVGLHL
uniref:Synaptotagmin 12 n=1 Tax=Amazona collaria TaxID=241587 RepID=A0A8B9G0U1_9PSIT